MVAHIVLAVVGASPIAGMRPKASIAGVARLLVLHCLDLVPHVNLAVQNGRLSCRSWMRSLHARVNCSYCSPNSQLIQHIQLSEQTNPSYTFKSHVKHIRPSYHRKEPPLSPSHSPGSRDPLLPPPKGVAFSVDGLSVFWWIASLHGKTPRISDPQKSTSVVIPMIIPMIPMINLWRDLLKYDDCIHQEICAVLFIPDLHFHHGSWPHL